MSTKNLGFTIMQGGRSHNEKAERRQTNRGLRRDNRALCRHLAENPETEFATPVRKPFQNTTDFADKLGAGRQWLGSHVGQPWQEIERKLLTLINRNSLAGRHLLGHLYEMVKVNEHAHEGFAVHFCVDKEGLLQRKQRNHRRREHEVVSTSQLNAWLQGRAVREVGTKRYWATPTSRRIFQARGEQLDRMWHYLKTPFNDGWRKMEIFPTFRSDQRFSPADEAMWAKLTNKQRRLVLLTERTRQPDPYFKPAALKIEAGIPYRWDPNPAPTSNLNNFLH